MERWGGFGNLIRRLRRKATAAGFIGGLPGGDASAEELARQVGGETGEGVGRVDRYHYCLLTDLCGHAIELRHGRQS